jgi:hypothetical protein
MTDSRLPQRPEPGTRTSHSVRSLITSAALVLFALAVGKELRTPGSERQWHGELFGFVPYDLRLPTPTRLRWSLWSPDDDRFFLPRSFGVGWSPNLARIVRAGRGGRAPA